MLTGRGFYCRRPCWVRWPRAAPRTRMPSGPNRGSGCIPPSSSRTTSLCWRTGAASGPAQGRVAKHHVAAVGAALLAFRDHPLLLRRHEIEEGIAVHAREASRRQERLDGFPGSTAVERELCADRRVLRAASSAALWICRGADVELPVDDDEAAGGPKDPDPVADGRLRMRERPEQVTADD